LQAPITIAVVLLVIANLNAWVFAGKKLIQSRHSSLAKPARAVTVYFLLTATLLAAIHTDVMSVADLFSLSNQAWILIYGVLIVDSLKQYRSQTRFVRASALLSVGAYFMLVYSAVSVTMGLLLVGASALKVYSDFGFNTFGLNQRRPNTRLPAASKAHELHPN
jgi:hypothetical protein